MVDWLKQSISLHTKENYGVINKNEVDFHNLIQKDEGDVSEKEVVNQSSMIFV